MHGRASGNGPRPVVYDKWKLCRHKSKMSEEVNIISAITIYYGNECWVMAKIINRTDAITGGGALKQR